MCENDKTARVRTGAAGTAFVTWTVHKWDDSSHVWRESGQKNPINRPVIITDSGRSTLRHLCASGFEDFALALGQALDAVGGNFVEYRVHFAADEFGRGKIVHGLGAFLSPE